MNNKKIWIFAIVFGLLMSILFYFLTAKKDAEATENQEQQDPLKQEQSHETTTDGETIESPIKIESGKRAISIPVDAVQSVSGFVSPGTYVDIVAVFPPTEKKPDQFGQILISHVKVLAVGKTVDESAEISEPYQMVTLEVTPEDGARLALAKESATLTLMLEGGAEQEISPSFHTSLEQLNEGKMSNEN